MTYIDAQETAWAWGYELDVLTEEQAASIGNKLHQLDVLIEFIAYHDERWDLHTVEYANSLIFPTHESEWPFSVFPDITAVQDMYFHPCLHVFKTFLTCNGTWTR